MKLKLSAGLNMCPIFSIYNIGKMLLRNIKDTGKIVLSLPHKMSFSYFKNHLVCEFAARGYLASGRGKDDTISSFIFPVPIIVSSGANKKVVRSNAWGIVALMKNTKSFWNFSVVNLPRKAMGLFTSSADIQISVPVLNCGPGPHPAPIKWGYLNLTPKVIHSVLLALSLSGCASLQDFGNTLFGNSSQKITRTPIWVYRSDIWIEVDGGNFLGMAVTKLSPSTDVQIWSQVNIDRVEISTCSRHDVCQIKGGVLACDIKSDRNPNGRFQVNKDWFGNPGKYMVYTFIPDLKERDDSCANATIAIYDKNALAAWGYIVFRSNPENEFPATMTCNASDTKYAGVSVCSAKAGTIQQINFDKPVDKFRADAACNMTKVSDTRFDIQPVEGWCRASFAQNKKFHDLILNGYSEVLIRDGK